MTGTIKPKAPKRNKIVLLTDRQFAKLNDRFAGLKRHLGVGDYTVTAKKIPNVAITPLEVTIEPSPAYSGGNIRKILVTFNDLVDAHHDRVCLAEILTANARIETKEGKVYKHQRGWSRVGDLPNLYHVAAATGMAHVMEDYRNAKAEKTALAQGTRAAKSGLGTLTL